MNNHKNGSPSTWLSRKATSVTSASPANVYWGGSKGFIAKYPGAAAAYSLRKLASGPVVTLRRASDNTEQDFTAADLNNGVAEAWSQGGDAFVRRWYDQSGNGLNVANATLTEQPLLISAGVINKSNGEPAINFNSSLNQNLESFNTLDEAQPNMAFLVTDIDDAVDPSTGYSPASSSISTKRNHMVRRSDGSWGIYAGTGVASSYTGKAQSLFSGKFDGAGSSMNRQGVPIAYGDAGSYSYGDKVTIGKQLTATTFYDGDIQEYIFYNSSQANNRIAIENNIANAWGMPYPTQPIISPNMPEPIAAWSFRDLGNGGNVVRLRRASDNTERDFTTADLKLSSLGDERVVNGDFSDGSNDWQLDPGWSVSGGEAIYDGTGTGTEYLRQDDIWTAESGTPQYYLMTFTIVACSNFSQAGTFGGVGSTRSFASYYGITEPGTYRCIRRVVVPSSNNNSDRFRFYCKDNHTLTIKDISLRDYHPSPSELWAFDDQDEGIGNQSGEGAAYVRYWYDQSPNGNDLEQDTLNEQPKLIAGGIIVSVDGEPSIHFNGSTTLKAPVAGSVRTDSFYVVQTNDTDHYTPTDRDSGTGFAGYLATQGDTTTSVVGTAYSTGGNELYVNSELQSVSDRNDVYTILNTGNQILRSDINATTDGWASIAWGADYTGAEFEGNLQEWLIYDSDQSDNRQVIESNINGFYNIWMDDTWNELNNWNDDLNWDEG